MYPDQRAPQVPRRPFFALYLRCVLLSLLIAAPLGVEAADVVRKPLEADVTIALKGGRTLYLECRPPRRGSSRHAFLQRYLADEGSAGRYRTLSTVPLMYKDLKPEVQRRVIETIFPDDFADPAGWWHTVTYDGSSGVETWWNLAEWLTGKGTDYKTLEALPENRRYNGGLAKGNVVLIPRDMLLEVFQRPTPGRERRVILEPLDLADDIVLRVDEQDGPDLAAVAPGEIRYGRDGKGEYAAYRLKKGEALYTSVVIRFTDLREVAAVQEAAADILARNNIADPHKIHVGQEIRIPLEMLSDSLQPAGSERRDAFDASIQEARRLRTTSQNVKDLDGVVIVLDPGHGGTDQGASHGPGILEDEINYDIAVRIKHKLETTTRARVYMTLMDLSEKYTISNATRFVHDTDEVVLTNPPYHATDVKVSANLRWYVANDIYRKELARGVKPENMLFMSIHCDALYEKLRGTMAYIPGAAYRDGDRSLNSGVYARYTTAGHTTATSTMAERRRDEALSRNFAETLMHALRTNNPPIAVHRDSDPIRNVIQRSRNERWIPAVLKHNQIPTKVLVEVANLKNPTDQQRITDPQWRDWYADAVVRAIRAHFAA